MHRRFVETVQRVRQWLSQFDWAAIIGSALALAFLIIVLLPVAREREYQPNQYPAAEPTEQASIQDRSAERVAIYTGWLAIFTALLTIVSAFQLWFLNRSDKTARISAEAASDSAEAAIAAQRPWLKFDFTIVGDCRFRGDRLYVPFQIVIKNVGNSPATHVQPSVALVCGGFGVNISEALRKIPALDMMSSYTLFPHEDVSTTQYGSVSKTEIDAALTASNIARRITIGGIISVKYRFGGSDRQGETSQSFLVAAKGNFFEMFDVQKFPVPKDQLILMPQPLSSTT